MIGLIPLDNRPVCYDFPRQLARVAGWNLKLPPASLMKTAGLKSPVSFANLQHWLTHLDVLPDRWILSADMLAYGGLIPSRVGMDSPEFVKQRLEQALHCFPSQRVAFSSILRIPDYDSAEEEPDYWATWGKRLYRYSVSGGQTDGIPEEVLQDFLARRAGNFAINQWLVTQVANRQLQGLVFCQDDTGPIGLNVQEAETLREQLSFVTNDATQAAASQLWGMVQTGADELAVCLLARMAISRPYRVWPVYSDEAGARLMAPFDGLPFDSVVKNKLALCGAHLASSEADADLVWVVHVPTWQAGDHMEECPAVCSTQSYESLYHYVLSTGKPVCLADVAYANGGDPVLTDWLLAQPDRLPRLYGYAAWNTPGNTLGSALAMALTRLDAENTGTFNQRAFEQLLVLRLLDDGIYQGHVRARLRAQGINPATADPPVLTRAMQQGVLQLTKVFPWLSQSTPDFSWPCQRLFEIKVLMD